MCGNDYNGPLNVETYSGFSLDHKYCEVDNIHDIRHIVRFYNLRNYPVEINCTASLTANPGKIEFKSTLSSDPNTTNVCWQGTITSLGIKGKQDFSHVRLINLQTSFGDEGVNVEIQANWPQPGKRERIELSFTVKVL